MSQLVWWQVLYVQSKFGRGEVLVQSAFKRTSHASEATFCHCRQGLARRIKGWDGGEASRRALQTPEIPLRTNHSRTSGIANNL